MSRIDNTDTVPIFPVTRRRFVQGLTAGAALAAVDLHGLPAFGEVTRHMPKTLSGQHFDLTIHYLPVNFTGRRVTAMAVNGSVPGPILRWREGDHVTIAVTNLLKVSTSVHWHSLRIPADMDGVPGLSYPGIAPGETFHYHFQVKQNGTAWYHSHTRFQEQSGIYGPLIIDPNPLGADPIQSDREHVIFLSDWTDTNPETIFSNLKEESDYYNYHKHTLPEFFSAIRRHGFRSTLRQRLMWAKMNMSDNDISDISAATYTYLLNGNPPNANWTGLFSRGEKVRLRFINGSAMTFFDVRIPGLKMTVVQADGNDVEPVPVDEFRIGVAERYDVIVGPSDDKAYTIFAQSEDRTGFARGTLAPRMGMTAPIPPMDPRPRLTMIDMGMGSMAGMKMANMNGIDGMTADDMRMGNKVHGGEHSHMNGNNPEKAARDRMAEITNAAEMSMASMPHMGNTNASVGKTPFPQPSPYTTPAVTVPESEIRAIESHLKPSNPVKLHLGPSVAQISGHVESRLNTPGIGLDHNGRRVLTYADLRSPYRGVDGRPPSREIELHLTGNMNRYIWGFNGEKFSNNNPIVLKLGERVRFVLINDTMMSHPIHLHGLWSELENGHGEHRPFKDTIIVKPSERVTYLISADTPGRWAYHCHLLYHMQAGMFRAVVVLP